MAVVVVVVLGLGGGFYTCLVTHPASQVVQPPPESDAAPSPMPDAPGTICQQKAVNQVRTHPGLGAATVEKAATARLEELATSRGKELRIIGWRGREDQDDRYICRVSFRYLLGDERGASIWVVNPEAHASDRLSPQDTLSIESTGRVPFDAPEEERNLDRKCRTDGVEKVQRHFSYMEEYGIWAAMRKREVKERSQRGTTIEWGAWSARPEGVERCLVSLGYTEDGQAKTEYWRLRWTPGQEHAVLPLSPRAIESIYGPGVYSR